MGADAPTELYRKLIEAVYLQFNNDKIGDISRIMEKYEGQEAEIYDKVVRKYVFSQKEAIWRPLLEAMYERFNPTKLPDLGKILLKYKDSEAALFKALCDKYIPDIKKSDPLPVLNVWDKTGAASEEPDVREKLPNVSAWQAADAADSDHDGDQVASVSQPVVPSDTEAAAPIAESAAPAADVDVARGGSERGEREGGRRKRQCTDAAEETAIATAGQQCQPAETVAAGASRDRRRRRAAEDGVNGRSRDVQVPELNASAPAAVAEVPSAAEEAPPSELPQPEASTRDRPRRRAAKAAAVQTALAAGATDGPAQPAGDVGEAERRPRRRHRHARDEPHPEGQPQTDAQAPNESEGFTSDPAPATRPKAMPRRSLSDASPGRNAEAPGTDAMVATAAPDYAVPAPAAVPAAAAVVKVKRRRKLPPPPDPIKFAVAPVDPTPDPHPASPEVAAAPEASKVTEPSPPPSLAEGAAEQLQVTDPSPPPSLAEGAAEEPNGLANREAFLRQLLLKAKAKVQVPTATAAPSVSQSNITVGMRPSKRKRAALAPGAEHAKVAAAGPVRSVHLAPNAEAAVVKPRAHKERHRTGDRIRRQGHPANSEPVGADPYSHTDPVDADENLAEEEGVKKVILRSHKDVLREKGLDSEAVFHWRADN